MKIFGINFILNNVLFLFFSAFRGFVAFVAFFDIGSAARAYIEKRSFLGDHSDSLIHDGKC